jgi:hypothetical protein
VSETTTYATLAAAIQTYTEDDSPRLVGEIPAVIARASDRIQADADLEIFDQAVDASLAYKSRVQTIPYPWLRIRSIYLTDFGVHLDQRSTQYLDALGPNAIGMPKYFDVNDVTFAVGPMPDQNYRASVTYIGRLASLSPANPTNWLTVNMPRLMLYACLAESERILVAPTQASMWDQQYQEELARQLMVLRGDQRRDYMPLAASASAPPPQ